MALQVGDRVQRVLAGHEMRLQITGLDELFIYCGCWKFSQVNGAEIDEDLGWTEKVTGSYLKGFQDAERN